MGALLVGALAAQSTASDPVAVEGLSIGIEGNYKVGEWTSLRLDVTSDSARRLALVVEAPDSDDQRTTLPGPLVDVPAGAATRFETVFRTGRLQGHVRVQFVDDSQRVVYDETLRAAENVEASLRPALQHDVPLWVVIGSMPELALPGADKTPPESVIRGRDATAEPRLIRVASLDDLPQMPRGLASVDFLMFTTAPRGKGPSPLERLTPADSERLRAWVTAGGHLLVSVAAADEAFRTSPLSAWIPAGLEATTNLRQLPNLENFSGSNALLRVPGGVRVARFAALPARNVIVREAPGPMIVSVAYGFGRVTLLGIDPETAPVSTWPGLPAVIRKIAGGRERAAPQQSQKVNRQLSHTGITELATQVQLAQEHFPAVVRPSYWLIMGVLAAYLLAIGPVDYLVVHRLLKRPELTWFTFPVLVCAGAAGALWFAGRVNDHGPLYNQLDLVDADASTGALRARTWASLYSPGNRRFAVSVTPQSVAAAAVKDPAASSGVQLTWSGVPENSVSGEYRPGAPGFGSREYRFSTGGSAIENLPVLQWSTRTLFAEWSLPLEKPLIDSRLESAGPGQLSGTLTHHLPGPLEECLLVIAGWAYIPEGERGMIPADVPFSVSGNRVRSRDLKALLTGERRTRREKDKYRTDVMTTTVPYNPHNDNRLEIAQMLTFHQAVGGSDYTGLRNQALRGLELTPLMQLGQGILIGRLKTPAARVTIDGESSAAAQHDTIVRLLFPVKNLERAPAAILPKTETP